MQRILLLKWVTRNPNEGHFFLHFELLRNVISDLDVEFLVLEMHSGDTEAKLCELIQYCLKNQVTHIHLDWMLDIEFLITEFDQALANEGITWSSLGHLSPIFREASIVIEDHWFIRKIRATTALKFILVWDEFLNKKSQYLDDFIVAIPDYQNTNEIASTCVLCDEVSFNNLKKPIVGVVGQLYGYRGSERLLKKWNRFGAGFTPLLAGNYFRDSHSHKTQKKIKKFGKLKKIVFHPNFISSDSELNHIITHCDAIYIDTISYKVSSGIAQRALQLSVPVLIEISDSCLNDRSSVNPGYIIWPKISDLRKEIQFTRTVLREQSIPDTSKEIYQRIQDEFIKVLSI